MRKSLISRVVAEESAKTKKARAKLKEKLDAIDRKVSPQALAKKSQEIYQWIERHTKDRIPVNKDISLFDQNQNSAKMSRNTEKMAEEIQKT